VTLHTAAPDSSHRMCCNSPLTAASSCIKAVHKKNRHAQQLPMGLYMTTRSSPSLDATRSSLAPQRVMNCRNSLTL
jgi:hypothetical protein